MENNFDLSALSDLEMFWAEIVSAYQNTMEECEETTDIESLENFPSLIEETKDFLKQFDGDSIPKRLVWLSSLMGQVLANYMNISDEYSDCRCETWNLIWDFMCSNSEIE